MTSQCHLQMTAVAMTAHGELRDANDIEAFPEGKRVLMHELSTYSTLQYSKGIFKGGLKTRLPSYAHLKRVARDIVFVSGRAENEPISRSY
jgi:hypothetical protein